MSDERILICAGEVSGDLHGARLVEECLRRSPGLKFTGIGGERLAAAGVDLRMNIVDRAVMGWSRIASELPAMLRLLAGITEEIRIDPPDQVVVIDYPGLNINIAQIARRHGIPVTYYICPQVWAWAPWRIRRIAASADQLLVVLPFEEELYRGVHPRVHHVGNPVFDHLADLESTQEEDEDDAGSLLAILPGSRRQEVEETLPTLLDVARVLIEEDPDLSVGVSCQRGPLRNTIDGAIEESGLTVEVTEGSPRQLQQRAKLAIVASGTATLEQAWYCKPMMVVYPTSEVSRAGYSLFAVAPYFALVNLVAGEEVVPEILFQPGSPEPLIRIARELLDPRKGALARERLRDLRQRRFETGATERAADRILDLLRG